MVEVDGYKYHKEDNKQKERDVLKNNILSKYKNNPIDSLSCIELYLSIDCGLLIGCSTVLLSMLFVVYYWSIMQNKNEQL